MWKPQAPEDALPQVSCPELLYLRDCLARYREQQKREQSAQRKDLEKQTRYLQNISHQIKTPLAGISLCHDYLEATETSPQKRELLRQSRVQINHIEALIRELLLLARLDAGKAAMKLERIPLGQLLERVQQTVHGLAADREAAVFWDYPEDLSVLCDRFWIQEVLLNLLKNALEHIPAGGPDPRLGGGGLRWGGHLHPGQRPGDSKGGAGADFPPIFLRALPDRWEEHRASA